LDNWLKEPFSRLDADDNDVSSDVILATVGRAAAMEYVPNWWTGVDVGRFGVEVAPGGGDDHPVPAIIR
jgi:hypothetical protein